VRLWVGWWWVGRGGKRGARVGMGCGAGECEASVYERVWATACECELGSVEGDCQGACM
jgi:hypothetical protein